MPRDLSRSIVVVTGASSGIGRATALAFARAGDASPKGAGPSLSACEAHG